MQWAGLSLLAMALLLAVLHAVYGRVAQDGSAVAPAGVRVLKDLVYARPPEKDLHLDLYLPPSGQGPHPVVLFIHGGAWWGGSKDNPPAGRLVAAGYAVASISYRLSQEAIFPAQIHDAKAAVRWLRAHAAEYGLDPERIAAWGLSAGGHLAALLGTSGGVEALEGDLGHGAYSSRVQAVIDFYGPSDFFRMYALKGNPDSPDHPEARLVGGPLRERSETVIAANPITYVSGDDPPFLIVHGARDRIVPPNQSELLAAALKGAGVDVTYRLLENRGHSFVQGPEIDPLVDAFLARHIGAAANRRRAVKSSLARLRQAFL